MTRSCAMRPGRGLFLLLIFAFAWQVGAATAADRNAHAVAAVLALPQEQPVFKIENNSQLRETYVRGPYGIWLRARGGVPALHWKVEKGALPPGITLEADGLLHGEAQRAGEFQFTASVTDSGSPQQKVEKPFVIRVRAALTLKWKTPAHVNGNRIEGSAEVSNTTDDDMDLTFIVLAVAENGRATAIGYQHFVLQGDTPARELSFGDTLPHGGYVVHVDTVGEVEQRDLVYRERLQTPGPLQVIVGP